MCTMHNRIKHWIIPLTLLLPIAWAHPAVITGTVYDAINGIYLEGARVVIIGTDHATTSERGGRFRFTGVEPGSYDMAATATGYPTLRMQAVISDPFDEVRINFDYTADEVFELEAFVVEGSLIGAAKAIDVRRSSVDFREVISSDAFGQFTDRNPAEALQRVAGIAVEGDQGEGRFLIVRGMAPEFSQVQIDGVGLATPEEDGRKVNLNVITVDQIERIEASKTWLPSQRANVIGATVNIITRSALDRGERFASAEYAGTKRDNQKDLMSWRGAFTVGEIIDNRNASWLGDKAIGLQFSINQSDDYSGSDTVNWSWSTRKVYPHTLAPGETEPRGFTLSQVDMRNFNINRERLGMSGRLEIRLSPKHQIYGALSRNNFDDTVKEHLFYVSQSGTTEYYDGAHRYYTAQVAAKLGHDVSAPFNAYRLGLPGNDPRRYVTFNEAFALGDMAFDPDLMLFTNGGAWPMPMSRNYRHTVREDRIDTYQFGGKHELPWEIAAEWRVFSTEAEQNTERNWLNMEFGSSPSGSPRAGPDYANPYIKDLSTTPAALRKETFYLNVTTTGGTTVRELELTESLDERQGGSLDLKKSFSIGASNWVTRVGADVDKREKAYQTDTNYYGVRSSDLNRTKWPDGRVFLADPFFDGGNWVDFRANFGPEMVFGPSFHEANTLAFMKGEVDMGVKWFQTPNHFINNVSDRVLQNYAATEDVTGYYLQQDVRWRKWTLIFGFRHEKTENTYTNLAILTRNPERPELGYIQPTRWQLYAMALGVEAFTRQVTSSRSYDHLLPALHLIREIGGDAMLRASVTKTIGRPLFTDLIPREIPTIANGAFGSADGNMSVRLPAFDLMPMEAVNYDVSFDYYLKPIGLFSAAVFYKDLDGPIYDELNTVTPGPETEPWELKYNFLNANWVEGRTIINQRGYNFTRKRNAGKGEVYGIELTYDRKLQFLPGLLNGFGINSNIAFIDSSARLVADGRARGGEKVSMFRQPDLTGNLSLYYEKYGLFARLSYNVRGKYLNSINTGEITLANLREMGAGSGAMDIWVEQFARLDFTMRYRVTPRFQVFFEAINLTNEAETRTRGGMRYIPHAQQFTERTFTLGVKWNL
jgi:TonB-dependent receptor